MPVWHGESGKKRTGGKIKSHRGKKKYELGSTPLMTRVGSKSRSKTLRTRGGSEKRKALFANKANVYDPSSKKTERVKIVDVVGNPANQHYVRRGIITKGAKIETELGLAKVTSRPSQKGEVNAVLVKE